MRLRILAVPLLLVLASCGERSAPPSEEPDPLRGSTFLAMAMTEDGRIRALMPGTDLSVEFTDDGRLIAQAGCNTMQGQVNTAGGTLAVDGGLVTTDMACGPGLAEQDMFVGSVLEASPSWRLDGDRLTITSGTTRLDMAAREAITPNEELTSTTWVLNTLIDGQVASSVPAGPQEMTLVFDGDTLTMKVFNHLQSEYTIVDNLIVFGAGTVTEMAGSPEMIPVENAVFGVLVGEVTYEITANQLTITHPSGKGIQLHAK
jgi:heat shock protein HslJ